MVCEYEMEEGILRVKCLGCVHGSSIEDYEECMAEVRTLACDAPTAPAVCTGVVLLQ